MAEIHPWLTGIPVPNWAQEVISYTDRTKGAFDGARGAIFLTIVRSFNTSFVMSHPGSPLGAGISVNQG